MRGFKWLQPSIVKRTLLGLAASGLLVLAVLMTFSFYEFKLNDIDELNAEIKAYAAKIAEKLQGVDDETSAAAIVKVLKSLHNSEGEPVNLYVMLENNQHQMLYRDANFPSSLGQPLNQLYDVNIDGQQIKAVTIEKGGLLVTLGRRDVQFSEIFLEVMIEYIFYIVLALPFFMLPTWLAVRHGVKPLKALNQHIAARHLNDLSPIDLDVKEAELQPVISSINQLLGQLSQKLEQEKSFVHDAAHELQTPLAGLITQANLLAKSDEAIHKKEALASMEASVLRVSHLIQQLLQLDRITHDMDDAWERVDVARLARESLLQHAAEKNYAHIQLSFHAPDQLMANTVPHLFLSIVNNLVSNAIRYTPKRSQIEVTLSADENDIKLRVADNGIGIPEAEWPFVFSRFYRAKGQLIEGTGLGLAIVEQAGQQLGGNVTVGVGIAGKGCAFEVTLPLVVS